jgi:hypothetical protein
MPSFSPLFGDATYGVPLDTTSRYAPVGVKEAIADVLVGAAAGSTATKNRTRVQHSTNAQAKDGGKRPLEVNADINRATTAADVTNLKRDLGRANRQSFAFARDLSGNGGPAFTRTF